jgi:hypothetical protein
VRATSKNYPAFAEIRVDVIGRQKTKNPAFAGFFVDFRPPLDVLKPVIGAQERT